MKEISREVIDEDELGENLRGAEANESERMNEYLDEVVGGNADSEWIWDERWDGVQTLTVNGKDGRFVDFEYREWREGGKLIRLIEAREPNP